MASITTRPNGHVWIQFFWQEKRRTWRLGRLSKRRAVVYKANLEELIESIQLNIDQSAEVRTWLKSLPKKHLKTLEKWGLSDSRSTEGIPDTVDGFGKFVVEQHYQNRADNTVRNITQTLERLKEKFGNCKLSRISQGDIDAWREEMFAEGMAKATIAFYLKKSRRIFNLAVSHRIIDENPVTGVKIPTEKNEDRRVYIHSDVIKQLLRVCSPEWQAAICLCRYGGLRFPSEVFQLTWDRINFETGKVCAWRDKTGRDVTVPMLPDVRRSLKWLWEVSGEKQSYLFPHYANKKSDRAPYTQLRKLVIRAGLNPWERLTTNLRVSLGVDLKLAGVPQTTIAVWLDHTSDVHQDHYDLVSEDEFDVARTIDLEILIDVDDLK